MREHGRRPEARAAPASALREVLLRRYAALFADPINQAFFGGSGYANYGLWDASTRHAQDACDRLVEALLQRLPRRDGMLLDVSCGEGGTTRRLAQAGFAKVVALDLMRPQLQAARKRAPAAWPVQADAARLPFAAGSFAAVVCVEAAFHFATRADFLREAHRVLAPGGGIALADVLVTEAADRVPAANFVAGTEDYAAVLRGAGFTDVAVDDVRAQSWQTFKRRYARFVLARACTPLVLRRLPALLGLAWSRYRTTDRAIRAYVLARGTKAAAAAGR